MANIQQAPIPALNNPAIAQTPEYIQQVLDVQRRARLADMLLQRGMAPLDYDRRGAISWQQQLGNALSAAAGAYGGFDLMQQQAKLQAEGNQRLLAAYGGGQPSPAALADQIDPRAAAALGAGAQAGSVGPTIDNARRMDAMPAPAPALQPVGTPLNPFGAPPMLAMMASQGDPGAQEQLKTWLANRTMTPEQKNWRDPVGGPAVLNNLQTQNMTELQKLQLARSRVADGTPQAQQLDAAIQKANYIAPAEVRQGNVVLDRNNLPIFYNPKTAEGVAPMFQTVNGVTTPTGARALPGYAGANASIAGAEQGARQSNTVFTNVLGPDGSPQSGFLFGGRGGGGGGGGAGAGFPTAGGGGGLPVQPRPAEPSSRPGVITGPSTTDAAIQKSAADVIAQAPHTIQQSRMAITGLESALRTLDGVPATGPGTVKTAEVIAAFNNILPDAVSIGPNGVNNYQALTKFLANSLHQAAQGTGTAGTDARFESFMHGQPNQETMSKPALEGAIRFVLSQHDAAAARGQFIADAYNRARAAGDPNAAITAQAQWSQAYQPDYFAFNRMSPTEQANFLKSKGKGAAAWVQQYNDYAGKTGWVH